MYSSTRMYSIHAVLNFPFNRKFPDMNHLHTLFQKMLNLLVALCSLENTNRECNYQFNKKGQIKVITNVLSDLQH